MSMRVNPFNRCLRQVLPSIGFSSTPTRIRTEFWKGEWAPNKISSLSFSTGKQSQKCLFTVFAVLALGLQKKDTEDAEIVRKIYECLKKKPTPWNEFDGDGERTWNPHEIANAYILMDHCKTVELAKSISDPTLRSTVLVDIIKVLLGCDTTLAVKALEAISVESKRVEATHIIREHFRKVRMPCPLDFPEVRG